LIPLRNGRGHVFKLVKQSAYRTGIRSILVFVTRIHSNIPIYNVVENILTAGRNQSVKYLKSLSKQNLTTNGCRCKLPKHLNNTYSSKYTNYCH